jgi:hypothetical protein
MSTSIRISKNTHKKLVELAGILQARLKRNVSIDETIQFLIKKRLEFGKITDLPGKWEISDEELEEIYKDLRKGWNNWSTKGLR